MVTTRSQDKMTFADKIRAQGFSLADCKFIKLNALFPIMLSLAHATVALWCGSGLAAAVVGGIPVADEKVPLFTIMFIPVYAILLSIIALEGLAALAPNGSPTASTAFRLYRDICSQIEESIPLRLPVPDRPRGQGARRHRGARLPRLGLDRASPVVAV